MIDSTETARRALVAELDQAGVPPEHQHETWDTDALRRDFEVLAFAAPFVVARRRSDGRRGTLMFTHQPRIYFGWQEEGR
jgi:hypothetical protein